MKRVALPFALSCVTLAALPVAAAAPAKADVEKAAVRLAGVLDGVLRNCPTSFAKIGTPLKACVGTGGTVENVRMKLVAELEPDLYGVWRSRDEQRSVFNWLKTPAGFVYVRLQPDPDGRAQTLVYVDTPPSGAPTPTTTPTPPATPAASAPANSTKIDGVTLTRPTPTPAVTPTSAPTVTAPATPTAPNATTSAASLAPVPYTRLLELLPQRINGQDVRAVQNRLIALTQPGSGGRGDGYFGPVTAATVRAFQAANGLSVTGRVDRDTWNVLFSASAKPFKASAIR